MSNARKKDDPPIQLQCVMKYNFHSLIQRQTSCAINFTIRTFSVAFYVRVHCLDVAYGIVSTLLKQIHRASAKHKHCFACFSFVATESNLIFPAICNGMSQSIAFKILHQFVNHIFRVHCKVNYTKDVHGILRMNACLQFFFIIQRKGKQLFSLIFNYFINCLYNQR